MFLLVWAWSGDRGTPLPGSLRSPATTGASTRVPACPPCRAPSVHVPTDDVDLAWKAPASVAARRDTPSSASAEDVATDSLAIAAMVLFLFGIGVAAGGAGPGERRRPRPSRVDRHIVPRTLRLKET